MKRSLTTIYSVITLAIIAAISMPAIGQIQITGNDLLNLRGKTFMSDNDERESFAVNVGSPGANQTWDFTSQTIPNPLAFEIAILNPQDTPYDTAFPGANFVNRYSTPLTPGFIGYEYSNITASAWTDLGEVFVSPPPQDTVIIEKTNVLSAPLPVGYNSAWTVMRSDTFGDFPSFAIISEDSIVTTVDGWGTVITQLGSFNSLRIQEVDFFTTTTIVGGVPISVETEQYINYIWVNDQQFTLASVQSTEGESDPNFTTASGFSVLTSVTGLEDLAQTGRIPTGFILEQNYPNPFNPSTSIRFSLPGSEFVELSIYNQLGQKVETLLSEQMAAGSYSLTWNAADLPSGVYFYRLYAGGQQQMKKAILMK